MILPLPILALILTAQVSRVGHLAARLDQAEAEHNRSSVIELLTQLTDELPDAPVSAVAATILPLVQSAADPDPHIRSLAFLALTALTNRAQADGTFSNDAIHLLEPALPALSKHLADPEPAVRELTALFLGGFRTNSAPNVVLPLLSTLANPEHPTPLDLSVIVALLSVNADPAVHPQIPSSILLFLRRTDLPIGLAVRILNAIANHPHHLPPLDAGLLLFLDPSYSSDLRATLIGVLPHLALSQSEFEASRSRLQQILASRSEDSVVVAAAAEVLPCWSAPRMADPCPTPKVHYRIMPQTAKPTITVPRYQSPLL